jgi:hypothetical protein
MQTRESLSIWTPSGAQIPAKLLRFRATAGNTENESGEGLLRTGDVWVLVDGKVRFRRREINGYNGGFAVAFAIHQSDRFLTLVATDAGNGIAGDWIVFGDPRLELLPAKTDGTFPSRRDVGQ